jgi:uncharacterized protein (DUF486 family)
MNTKKKFENFIFRTQMISKKTKVFFSKHWEGFLVNIFSGIVVAALTSVFLIYLFRVPNFEIGFDSFQRDDIGLLEGESVVTIMVSNQKYFLSFEKETVTYSFWIPQDLLVDGTRYFIHTPQGTRSAAIDSLTGENTKIVDSSGREYAHARSLITLPLYPRSTERVLSIIGKFDKTKPFKVCALFNTPYGRDPQVKDTKMGKIYTDVNNLKCREFLMPS